jgi:hypothetical protein
MAHVFQASPKVNYFKFEVGVCAAVKVMMRGMDFICEPRGSQMADTRVRPYAPSDSLALAEK